MNQPLEVIESRARRNTAATVLSGESTPMQLLTIATQQGRSIEELSKFMDLAERWQANQARQAYVEAMASFKAEPVTITKTKFVDVPGGAKFYHATLAECVAAAAPALAKHDLAHRWEVTQQNGEVSVTCVITHALGHSERVTMSAPPDPSGKKNPVQEIASTISYLERYTFLAATGLAAKDMDDDGRGGKRKPGDEPPPDGYDDWHADMEALAQEPDGKAKLEKAWAGSNAAIRRYVVKFDESWWLDLKKKAEKAS